MNFPTQNDFLHPFLSLLSDGASHSRHAIIEHMISHFNLTDEQISAKSGKHTTLINRVAWCDAHFVKAGFVQKEAHHPDSRFDLFMITPLGLRQLHRFADKLTVGYLQSFYLSKVIRGAGADDSVSDAERALSEAFNALGDAWTVIQGARWIGKDVATVGEIDFLVIHRKHGVLVLEVKGGVVAVENGVWTTTTQNGRVYTIQDPCAQAERNRRELRKWLNTLPQTKGMNVAI
ncbi:MAG: NERD domain-containing protein, partial [Anaerolineae bacterium]|nr:NERD domain-containing protein [Anaerolineae bacterium]